MSFLFATLLVVRTYNSAAAAADLAIARARAAVVMKTAAIELLWRDCHASACDDPVGRSEVLVRIVTAGPLAADGSLGFSYVDPREKAGSLATVYADRVSALATEGGVSTGRLLGDAIAHELGHLLLGTIDHASTGLMRAVWRSGEIRADRPIDWMFSRAEGARMRRGLALRTRAPAVPAGVVAADRREPPAPEGDRRPIPPVR